MQNSKKSKQKAKPQKKTATKKPPEKTTKTKQSKKESSTFKFRRYKRKEGKEKTARHPKLIVGENDDEFEFMGLTEDSHCGHHSNIKLDKNPKKGDKRQAYIRKEIRRDKKSQFYEILDKYNLSDIDKQKIIEYIEKIKKKK